MAPTLVELRSADTSVRLRTLGLSRPHPVLAFAVTTAELPRELAAGLAPVLRALLQTAVEHDAVVVTGGTDSGVISMLGAASVGLQPRPELVGVAPAGCVHVRADDGSDGRPRAEPHHRMLLLVPGTTWGSETAVLSRVVAAASKDLTAVCVLVGGGDVASDELREHLLRGRPVVVLRGSGRLADEVASGALAGVDGGLAGLLSTGDVRVVDIADGAGAVSGAVADALSPRTPRELRARVPALRAWPRLRSRPALVASMIGRDPADTYPALAVRIRDAEEVVVPLLREVDAVAQREQNRARWYVVLGLLGAFATTTLGAVQSWLDHSAWPGVAVATVGAATSALLTISRRQGSLDTYILARTRAERLRSLYFEYLAAPPAQSVSERRTDVAGLREEATRRRFGLLGGPARRTGPATAPVSPDEVPQAAGPAVEGASGSWRAQFLELYRWHRIDEQSRWYASRGTEYESALRTSVTLSAVLLVLAAFFGALGSADAGRRAQWAVCAAACGALAAAVNSYESMAGFGRLSRQYLDTLAGLRLLDARAAGADRLDSAAIATLVDETERLVLGEVTTWSVHMRRVDERAETSDDVGGSTGR